MLKMLFERLRGNAEDSIANIRRSSKIPVLLITRTEKTASIVIVIIKNIVKCPFFPLYWFKLIEMLKAQRAWRKRQPGFTSATKGRGEWITGLDDPHNVVFESSPINDFPYPRDVDALLARIRTSELFGTPSPDITRHGYPEPVHPSNPYPEP
jgi:hypothetical protein